MLSVTASLLLLSNLKHPKKLVKTEAMAPHGAKMG